MSNEPFNPYASPAIVEESIRPEAENRRLYEIAKAQRFLVLIIGVGMLTGILFQVLLQFERADRPWFNLALFSGVGVQLVVSVLQSVAMFRMGKTVHNLFQAVGLAIFSFIPCIGLIVMLIINNQATTALQAGGIKVGFLGADLSQFDPSIRG